MSSRPSGRFRKCLPTPVVESSSRRATRSNWLARHTLDKSAAIAHFDPYAVRPFESAERIQQPVFMAHGDADERIPLAFGRINFEHLASAQKEWHTVRGAGHNGIWARGGVEYRAAMLQFLERQRVE